MTTTLDQATQLIPLNEIDGDDRIHPFRLERIDFHNFLVSNLRERGQIYPLTLIEKPLGRFSILDGFSRVRAFRVLAQEKAASALLDGISDNVPVNSGEPFTVHAHVLRAEPSALTCFKWLVLTNMNGPFAYGSYERGLFFRFFLEKGFSIRQMAYETRLSPHDVEDWIELGLVSEDIGRIINQSEYPPHYLAMLVRRARGWLNSPFNKDAEAIIQTLMNQTKEKLLTMKSWRFLLDFYWNGNRPFMSRLPIDQQSNNWVRGGQAHP